jgi:hypothetical protein
MHKVRKIVHHLRSKPEEERRHILHLFMIFAIGIMLVLWVLSLGRTFNDPDLKIKVKEDLQPFSVLKSNLIDGFQGVRENETDVVE